MTAPAKDLDQGRGRETSSAYSTASRDFDDALTIVARRLLLQPALIHDPYALAAKFDRIIAAPGKKVDTAKPRGWLRCSRKLFHNRGQR